MSPHEKFRIFIAVMIAILILWAVIVGSIASMNKDSDHG